MPSPLLFNPSQFEYPYGIGIFDNIHNVLPELLYDPGLFPQNPVIHLLQQRVCQLFPHQFATNQTNYSFFQLERRRREAGIPRIPLRQAVATHTAAQTPLPQSPTRIRTPPPRVRTRVQARTTTIPLNSIFGSRNDPHGDPMESFVSTLLGTALGSMGAAADEEEDFSNLTSVPIIPTRAQIAEATVVTSIQPPADVVCAICQSHTPDDQESPDEWRIIRHCQHRFHRDCIDTWLEQNVHCPVCRFDIRNHRREQQRQQAEDSQLP